MFLFTREPMFCETAVYESTLAKCVQVFSAYPGIQAIYQYGGVSAPGISDLDLLLVFEERTPPLPTDWRGAFNKQELYLLMHDPTVISPSLLAYGLYITSLQGLTLLWGRPYPIHPLEPPVADVVNHWIVLEHTTRLYVSLMRQWHLELVKQRPLLCELHSIRYDLTLTGLFPSYETWFLQPIQQLRQNWFTMSPQERRKQLMVLFETAVQIEQTLLTHLEAWAARLLNPPIPATQATFPTHWPGIHLVSETGYFHVPGLFNLLAYLPDAKWREKLARFFTLHIGLPPHLLSLLQGQTNPFLEPYTPVYRKRQAILQQYAQFCDRLGGGFGRLHSL